MKQKKIVACNECNKDEMEKGMERMIVKPLIKIGNGDTIQQVMKKAFKGSMTKKG